MKVFKRICSHLFAFWLGGAFPSSCMMLSLGGGTNEVLKYGLGWPYWTILYTEQLVEQFVRQSI